MNPSRHQSHAKKRSRFCVGVAALALCLPISDAFMPHARLMGSSPVFVESSNLFAKKPSLQPAVPPRLTPEEQNELLVKAVEARKIQQQKNLRPKCSPSDLGYETILDLDQALYDGQLARETLVTRSIGLVYYTLNTVLKGQRNHPDYADLVQEGCMGLARAVDKWDPEIGGRFSSYAVYWVRAAILRGLAEKTGSAGMRIPEHASQALRQVTKVMGLDWHEAAQAKELATKAGIPKHKFDTAVRVHRQRKATSLEGWMSEGNQIAAADDGFDEDQQSKLHIRQVLEQYLGPKEIEALSLRYGLQDRRQATSRDYLADAEEHLFGNTGRWGEAMSFREVGRHMSVSAEYGRRLCHKAIQKLQKAVDEGSLDWSSVSMTPA